MINHSVKLDDVDTVKNIHLEFARTDGLLLVTY